MGRKNRMWSDEEKRSICRQTLEPGVSVAQVARRYVTNSNLIFKWLGDARFAPQGRHPDEVAGFLPVEMSVPQAARQDITPEAPQGRYIIESRIEIALSDGQRIKVDGCNDLDVILRLVKELVD